MRIGRLILGGAVLSAVGAYVYKNASESNKKKLLGFVNKAIDWMPARFKGFIPEGLITNIKDKVKQLKDKVSGGSDKGTSYSSDSVGSVGTQTGSSLNRPMGGR